MQTVFSSASFALSAKTKWTSQQKSLKNSLKYKFITHKTCSQWAKISRHVKNNSFAQCTGHKMHYLLSVLNWWAKCNFRSLKDLPRLVELLGLPFTISIVRWGNIYKYFIFSTGDMHLRMYIVHTCRDFVKKKIIQIITWITASLFFLMRNRHSANICMAIFSKEIRLIWIALNIVLCFLLASDLLRIFSCIESSSS